MRGLGISKCLLAAALLSHSPTFADVRLQREAGGDFSVQVMSWWEIPFRTVVRQQHDFSCGSAAIATLLSYHYHRPSPERNVFLHMWRSGDRAVIRQKGFSMLDMKAYLDANGYRSEGFRISIDELQKVKRPTIVLLDMKGFKHFVVVKGFSDDRILVGDPMLGLRSYSLDDFEAMWNGIVLAVMQTPDDRSPIFNLATDWNAWAKSPLDIGDSAINRSISDLTVHLPPAYQLSPQILLDVNVGTVP